MFDRIRYEYRKRKTFLKVTLLITAFLDIGVAVFLTPNRFPVYGFFIVAITVLWIVIKNRIRHHTTYYQSYPSDYQSQGPSNNVEVHYHNQNNFVNPERHYRNENRTPKYKIPPPSSGPKGSPSEYYFGKGSRITPDKFFFGKSKRRKDDFF